MPAEYSSACCDRRELQIQNYLDACLSAVEIADLKAHASACPACSHALNSAGDAHLALCNAAASLPVPGDLYSGFAAKLQQDKKQGLGLYSFGRASLGLAAAACLAMLWFHRPVTTTGTILQTSDGHNKQVAAIGPQMMPSGVSTEENQSVAPHTNSKSKRSVAAGEAYTPTPTIRQVQLQVSASRSERQVHNAKQVLAGQPAGLARITSLSRNRKLMVSAGVVNRYQNPEVSPSLSAATVALSHPLVANGKTMGKDTTITMPPAASGEFALVVQDDVRGFTSEVRGCVVADSREDRRLNSSADVHVEVLRDSDP